ncbi:MAG: hypothetical protein KJ721_02760 [Nanoarchaeota archaeon]|nr:hypothetical protein [Nanoarchaeota archaeon]
MVLKNQVKKAHKKKIMEKIRKAGSEEYETEWIDDKGKLSISKDKSKIKQGRTARARGARFELKVRDELESQGWIMDKWTNNVDLSSKDDSGEPGEGKLVKAKRKYNPFKKMLVVGTGFPDFIAFKQTMRRFPRDDPKKNRASAYTQPSRCRARAQDPKLRNKGAKNHEVIGVEVKMNGILSKIEKEKCAWYLNKGIFSRILIAKSVKDGRKIKIEYVDFKEKFGKFFG